VAANWACGLPETNADMVAKLPEAIDIDEKLVVVVLPETNGVDNEVSLDDEDVC
jgi:hypothetical protein